MNTVKTDKRNGVEQSKAPQQEPETQQMAAYQPNETAHVATAVVITEAIAIEYTEKLLARCKPRLGYEKFFHSLLEFFMLAVKSGEPVFARLLIECYQDERGEPLGEPPESYDNGGWMYLHGMISCLELNHTRYSKAGSLNPFAKQLFGRKMLQRATEKTELAKVFLKIHAACGLVEDTPPEQGLTLCLDRDIFSSALINCLCKEIKAWSTNNTPTLNEIQRFSDRIIDEDEIPIGWKRNRLVLLQRPNGRTPAKFRYGRDVYTVPSGKAWAIVCDLIKGDYFDGHGKNMKTPSDFFKDKKQGEKHRRFFSERMASNSSGWYIRSI